MHVENNEDKGMDLDDNTDHVQLDMKLDEHVEPGCHQDKEDAKVRQCAHPHQVGDHHVVSIQRGGQQEEQQQGLQEGKTNQEEQPPQAAAYPLEVREDHRLRGLGHKGDRRV